MAMQRWDLHRRIALRIIKAIGMSPSRIILGFMIATGFLSMWVSNTATTVMMTPIGLAVILQTRSLIEGSDTDISTAQGEFNFGTGLMLCIAYSASIGGIATIIGTPPNLILVGAISETFGREISFAQWMLYGVPIAVVGIAIVWGYVVKAFIPPRMDSIPGGLDVIDEELRSLGPMSCEEKLVFIVFVAAALAWISRSLVDPFAAIVTDDSIIAIGAALVLFLLPSRQGDGSLAFLLDWDTAVEIPWGVLLLFGGGLTIANGFEETGLAEWIGGLLSAFQGVSIALVIGVIVVLTISLTEVTSNTATTAMLMPILASLAVGSGPRGDRCGAHPRVHPLSGARRHAHRRAGRAIGVARWPHPARGRRGRGHRSPLLSRRPRGRYRSQRGLCERDARDEQGDLRSVGAPHRNFALGIKQVGVTAGSAISAVVVTGLAGP